LSSPFIQDTELTDVSNSIGVCKGGLQYSWSCDLRHMCRGSTTAAVEHSDPPVGRRKCPGLHSDGVILLHDNAQLHTAQQTQSLLQIFIWETLNHLPYSVWHRANLIYFPP